MYVVFNDKGEKKLQIIHKILFFKSNKLRLILARTEFGEEFKS